MGSPFNWAAVRIHHRIIATSRIYELSGCYVYVDGFINNKHIESWFKNEIYYSSLFLTGGKFQPIPARPTTPRCFTPSQVIL